MNLCLYLITSSFCCLGLDELSIKRYTAKIGYSNQPSLAMFRKIGFNEVRNAYCKLSSLALF